MKQNRNLTLEEIDGELWGTPVYPSQLVATCHALRRKALKDFSIEDLRIMIGQGMNLRELMPLALEQLDMDPMAEGDFYPGDLLYNVLRADPAYWREHQSQWLQLVHRIEQYLESAPNPAFDQELQHCYSDYRSLFPE